MWNQKCGNFVGVNLCHNVGGKFSNNDTINPRQNNLYRPREKIPPPRPENGGRVDQYADAKCRWLSVRRCSAKERRHSHSTEISLVTSRDCALVKQNALGWITYVATQCVSRDAGSLVSIGKPASRSRMAALVCTAAPHARARVLIRSWCPPRRRRIGDTKGLISNRTRTRN